MRVLKFGGTSVANADRFQTVADIALKSAEREQTALVLSAPAKITNLLVALMGAAAAGRSGEEEVAKIKAIIEPIITTLGERYPGFDTGKVMGQYQEIMALIDRKVQGILMLEQCPEAVMALVESRGEACSICIMSELLKACGRKVRIIDPVEVLVTEGGFMESTVNLEQSRQKYAKLADEPDAITLMAGFSGGNQSGQLVLLGRNGSDYSAACLAAVSQASCCEIWTDVDGVYSCDPRNVPDALLLSKVSYKEAMELSYFGAKVLHPRTIAPLALSHIPCLIKNTHNPDAPGTIIADETDPAMPIKGISDLKNVCLVNVSGPGMRGVVGMAGRLFTAVSRANISIILITQSSSEYSISFCIASRDLPKAERTIHDEFRLEFKEGMLDPLEIREKCAVISVVGDGMRTMCGTSGRFFRALAGAQININAIAQGSSERSISAVIDEDKVGAAVSVCHTAFFYSRQILDLIIVGLGGIGSELIKQIEKQSKTLKERQGIEIRVVGMFDSLYSLVDPAGIDLATYHDKLDSSAGRDFTLDTLKQLVGDNHLVNPILVDCTASESIAMNYGEFMKAGVHVVTPSKKANTASYEYYQELRRIARTYNRKFLYEANVGAGLPVINTLQNEQNAGDKLYQFSGIMSGTLSYIFGLVEDGKTLSEATSDAYLKGFTEPNPKDDLEGMDVARKLLILARECGYQMELSDVKVTPAVDPRYLTGSNAKECLENLKAADEEFSRLVENARREGKVLRYVGTIKDGVCECGVKAVDENDPLYRVRGGENALAFTTAYYQPIPLVIRGYGAGTSVTAAGVLSDVLRLQNWTREV